MNTDRGKAECVENYTKRQEVYRRLQGLEQERRRGAHSHFPGHAVTSERGELAICFNKLQRPAL